MIFFLLEGVLFFLLGLFLVTQVIIPGLKGETMFPLFSRKQQLKAHLAELEDLAEEQQLIQKIEEKETVLLNVQKDKDEWSNIRREIK